MRDTSLILKIAAVILLVIGVAGIYFMPHINYGEYAHRMNEAQQKITKLEKEIKDAILAFDSITSKMPDGFKAVQDMLDQMVGSQNSLLNKLQTLEQRVAALEQGDAKVADDTTKPSEALNLRFTDPITLSEELDHVANNSPGAAVIGQWEFDALLERLIQDKVIPQNYSTPLRDRLILLFEIYRNNIRMVSLQESWATDSLIQQANKSSNYVETENTREAIQTAQGSLPTLRGGIVAQRETKDGKVRIYRFSYEDCPHMLEFERISENAKRHFINDAYEAGMAPAE